MRDPLMPPPPPPPSPTFPDGPQSTPGAWLLVLALVLLAALAVAFAH